MPRGWVLRQLRVLLLVFLAACPGPVDQTGRRQTTGHGTSAGAPSGATVPGPLAVATLVEIFDRLDRPGLMARIEPLRHWFTLDNGQRVTGTILERCFTLVATYADERAACAPTDPACLEQVHQGEWQALHRMLGGERPFPERCGFELPSFEEGWAGDAAAVRRFARRRRGFSYFELYERERQKDHWAEARDRIMSSPAYDRAVAAEILCVYYSEQAGRQTSAVVHRRNRCDHCEPRPVSRREAREARRDFVAAGGSRTQSKRAGHEAWCGLERARTIYDQRYPTVLAEVVAGSSSGLCQDPRWRELTATLTDPMFASCKRTTAAAGEVPLPEPHWELMKRAQRGGEELRYQIVTEEVVAHYVFEHRDGGWHLLRVEECAPTAGGCSRLDQFSR